MRVATYKYKVDATMVSVLNVWIFFKNCTFYIPEIPTRLDESFPPAVY